MQGRCQDPYGAIVRKLEGFPAEAVSANATVATRVFAFQAIGVGGLRGDRARRLLIRVFEGRASATAFGTTQAGFLYLAVVLDAWSRGIVGWSMATHLRTELVLAAFEMALQQRRPAAGHPSLRPGVPVHFLRLREALSFSRCSSFYGLSR